jgi:uncharacterized protein (TIGR00369 family)
MSAEVKRIYEQAPFIADLGIELESLAQGECKTVLAIQPRHLQQDGYVHAGVQATVADHTAGAAAATLIREGQMVLTAEFRISLLRAARGERLRCTARVLKPGRQLTVVESEVFCIAADVEQLVSKATVTLAIVSGQSG